MDQIKTKKMIFTGYFFNRDTMRVISTKRKTPKEVKPLQDRVKPTWRLFHNGQYHLITLGEIIEFTIGIRQNSGLQTH